MDDVIALPSGYFGGSAMHLLSSCVCSAVWSVTSCRSWFACSRLSKHACLLLWVYQWRHLSGRVVVLRVSVGEKVTAGMDSRNTTRHQAIHSGTIVSLVWSCSTSVSTLLLCFVPLCLGSTFAWIDGRLYMDRQRCASCT